MSDTKKVAVYGGTFNPPHIGHIKAAESMSRIIQPDTFLIIPDFLPPHKSFDGMVSADDRLNMCKLAFSHVDNVHVSDIEIKRGGKSYTSCTLEELSADDRELYFLCGSDMFLTLSGWYRPEVIFKLATICYIRRENDLSIYEEILRAKSCYESVYGARIVEIPTDVIEVSSSEMRTAISEGEYSEFISRPVWDYIQERGLYK